MENKLYVVQKDDGFIPKGALVKIVGDTLMPEFVIVRELAIKPFCCDGQWVVKRTSIKELKHEYNIGDRVLNPVSDIGTVIFVANKHLLNSYETNLDRANEPLYIVKFDYPFSKHHEGKCIYFKGTRKKQCYFCSESMLIPAPKKNKHKFKIGDKIIYKDRYGVSCPYNKTTSEMVCKVVAYIDDVPGLDPFDDISVMPIKMLHESAFSNADFIKKTLLNRAFYDVNSKYFVPYKESEHKESEHKESDLDVIKIVHNGKEVHVFRAGKHAVAKCSPDDTFDLYTGANIALLRLLKGVE